ncbi:helix-turn-helix domain-containing protein [Crossiella sp. CA198]|uniref:helix-turn-helix domain-containing protein n=1 Tax=Crossiella sp. CA198 TaxID=3455607 RepID=UPI003F8D5395
MYFDDHAMIGKRVRELRTWRKLSLRAVAELSGISAGYLSRLERGERAVTKRAVLEALAATLRVSPTDLTEQPYPSSDPVTAEAQAALAEVEAALSDYALGQPPDLAPRPWPQVAADLHRLNHELRPATDYAGQGLLVPRLLADLHATYVADPARRFEVLRGLMHVYHTAAVLTKNLGVKGLPPLAAFHAQQVAEELGTPEWLGLAAWLRGHAAGATGRARQYNLSVNSANALAGDLDSPEVAQVYGMLHLNAALACAAQRREADAMDHLAEADDIAQRLLQDVGGFGHLYFGRTNVGIWRVSLGTELGQGGKVIEHARTVRPELIPSAARQAMFYTDLGRTLASDRKTRDQGVLALRKAEEIAPQRVRNNPFVRETVTNLLARAHREAVGRELRGLAYRMGMSA